MRRMDGTQDAAGTSGSRWQMLERRSGAALMLGPALMVLGLLLQGLVEATGIGRDEPAGIAVGLLGLLGFLLGPVVVALGLLGLQARLGQHALGLVRSGVVFVTLAAAAALILLAMFSASALFTGGEPPESTVGLVINRTVFQVFYAGLGLGFLLFGAAGWRSPAMSRTASGLLVAAGVLMFFPFTENLLAWFFDVSRPPVWISGPAWVFVLVALVAVGYSLRRGGTTEAARSDPRRPELKRAIRHRQGRAG